MLTHSALETLETSAAAPYMQHMQSPNYLINYMYKFGIKVPVFCVVIFQTAITIIGDQPAVSHVSVRTEPRVIPSKEPVSALQGF